MHPITPGSQENWFLWNLTLNPPFPWWIIWAGLGTIIQLQTSDWEESVALDSVQLNSLRKLFFIKKTLKPYANKRYLTHSSKTLLDLIQFSSIQSLSRVRLFATPWIAARQASLSITNSRSSLKLMSM